MAKKPTLTTLTGSLQNNIAQINANFTALSDAFDNTVSRDGSTPNAISADLDMNSNDVLNAKNIYATGNIYVSGKPITSEDPFVTPIMFATRAAAVSGEVPADVDFITVYHGSTKCVYQRDVSGTALTTGDGANWSPFGSVVTLQHWGYTPDGTTSCSTEARAAVVFLKTKGGGVLYLPGSSSAYAVDNGALNGASWDDQAGIWVDGDNIHIVGDGPGTTTLKLVDGGDAHVVMFGQRVGAQIAVTNCSISNLSIDGNRANQTPPIASNNHWNGIYFAYGGTNLQARNLHIYDCQYYGVGFQRDEFIDCLIEKCIIEDTGADGIDMKDDNGLSRNNTCRDVVVRRFGLESGVLSAQAGINPRAGWDVESCQVFEFTASSYAGIRVERAENARNPHANRVSNCLVDAGTATNLNRGIVINGTGSGDTLEQRGVIVANCHVHNVVRGFEVDMYYSLGSNLFAVGCQYGFFIEGNNVTLTNIQGLNSTGSTLLLDGNNIDISNFQSHNANVNITIESGANSCRIRHGIANNPTTTDIVDNGSTNFSIEGVNGISTRSSVVDSCPIDSTGDKALEWAHLLDKAPLEQDVWFTLVQDTAVTDYEILGPIITSIDASKVYATVNVKTASATGSAAVDIYCHSETYKASRY